MNRMRIISFITAVLASLTILFGVGPGHSLLARQSAPHGMQTGETSAQCQSICPPVLNEKQANAQIDKDEAEPEPLPFLTIDLSRYMAILYAVIVSALALSYLRRRPPDLITLYVNYRF